MSKRFVIALTLVVVTVAVVLSRVWHVPYVFTAIGFAFWIFAGHLVTADDDLPGGWSNPNGVLPFPWLELTLKGLVLIGLCAVALSSQVVRSWGAS